MFPEKSQWFLNGSSTWRPGGIPWQCCGLGFSKGHPKASQRLFNLACIVWQDHGFDFPEVSQRFLKGSSTWRPGGILWRSYGSRFPKSFPEVPHRFPNLAPWRHTWAILWFGVPQKFAKGFGKAPQPGTSKAYFGNDMALPSWVSQKFPKGSSKIPQPAAPRTYFGNIMALGSAQVSERFLPVPSTWHHRVTPWRYCGIEFPTSFPKVFQRPFNLAISWP